MRFPSFFTTSLFVIATSLNLGAGCLPEEEIDAEEAAVESQEEAPPPSDGTCSTHDHCGAGELCAFSTGQCGVSGLCLPAPAMSSCQGQMAEVCGCNGVTYANGCLAWQEGISVDHEGACAAQGSTEPPPPPPTTTPDACGGVICGAGEFCDFGDGTCGAQGSHGGQCMPKAGPCTSSPQQMCGCDGKTYSSSCQARQAGVSVVHAGPC